MIFKLPWKWFIFENLEQINYKLLLLFTCQIFIILRVLNGISNKFKSSFPKIYSSQFIDWKISKKFENINNFELFEYFLSMIDDFLHDWFFNCSFCFWAHFILFLKISDDGNNTIEIVVVILFDIAKKGRNRLKLESDSVFDHVVKLRNLSWSQNRGRNWMLNRFWNVMLSFLFFFRKEKVQIRQIWFST